MRRWCAGEWVGECVFRQRLFVLRLCCLRVKHVRSETSSPGDQPASQPCLAEACHTASCGVYTTRTVDSIPTIPTNNNSSTTTAIATTTATTTTTATAATSTVYTATATTSAISTTTAAKYPVLPFLPTLALSHRACATTWGGEQGRGRVGVCHHWRCFFFRVAPVTRLVATCFHCCML